MRETKKFKKRGDYIFGCEKFSGKTKVADKSCCYCTPKKHHKCINDDKVETITQAR